MSSTDIAPPSGRSLAWLFVTALVLRWAYAIAFYLLFGDGGLKGPDSEGYLALARGLAEAAAAGKVSGWAWLGPDLTLMPLITWTFALNAALAGASSAISFALFQGAVDAARRIVDVETPAERIEADGGAGKLAPRHLQRVDRDRGVQQRQA